MSIAAEALPALVSVYEHTSDIPDDVRKFVSEHACDHLWLGPVWFDLLWRYSPEVGERPWIYVVRSAERGGVECVLYAMTSAPGPGRYGRSLSSLTNFYTISYAPIVRGQSDDGRKAIKALARAISREVPRWDMIELRCLQEVQTTKDLVRACRSAGMLVDTYVQAENWFQPTSGLSADQYFRSLPSQLRNTVTRKLKRLKKEHELHIEIVSSTDKLAKAIEDYQTVYGRSWKEPEMHPDFIPQLLRYTAAEGVLRLGILYVDSVPAAAQIWLLQGERATIYKLAYDERYTRLSVGSILTKAMFEYVIDRDHVCEVDYGRGSETYKRDWMTQSRRLINLVAFNPRSPRGLAAATRHFVGRWIEPIRRLRGQLTRSDTNGVGRLDFDAVNKRSAP